MWYVPHASYSPFPILVYSHLSPSSLQQKVGSESCSTQSPLLAAFWLSSANGKYREKTGETKEMEVDVLVSLAPVPSLSMLLAMSGHPSFRVLGSTVLTPVAPFSLLPLQAYVWLWLLLVAGLWVLQHPTWFL